VPQTAGLALEEIDAVFGEKSDIPSITDEKIDSETVSVHQSEELKV